MESIKLFPITIHKTSIRDNKKLKELLVPDILEDSKSTVRPDGWGTNKIITSFLQDTNEVIEKNKDVLLEEYINSLRYFFDRSFDFNLLNIWYNLYMDGEYQEEHDHLSTEHISREHFSFIHFLSFDKMQHNPPIFADPMKSLRSLSIELDKNNYSSKYEPNIEEGDILMFPSYLRHYVLPCKKSDYPRITISFNIELLSYKK